MGNFSLEFMFKKKKNKQKNKFSFDGENFADLLNIRTGFSHDRAALARYKGPLYYKGKAYPVSLLQ